MLLRWGLALIVVLAVLAVLYLMFAAVTVLGAYLAY